MFAAFWMDLFSWLARLSSASAPFASAFAVVLVNSTLISAADLAVRRYVFRGRARRPAERFLVRLAVVALFVYVAFVRYLSYGSPAERLVLVAGLTFVHLYLSWLIDAFWLQVVLGGRTALGRLIFRAKTAVQAASRRSPPWYADLGNWQFASALTQTVVAVVVGVATVVLSTRANGLIDRQTRASEEQASPKYRARASYSASDRSLTVTLTNVGEPARFAYAEVFPLLRAYRTVIPGTTLGPLEVVSLQLAQYESGGLYPQFRGDADEFSLTLDEEILAMLEQLATDGALQERLESSGLSELELVLETRVRHTNFSSAVRADCQRLAASIYRLVPSRAAVPARRFFEQDCDLVQAGRPEKDLGQIGYRRWPVEEVLRRLSVR